MHCVTGCPHNYERQACALVCVCGNVATLLASFTSFDLVKTCEVLTETLHAVSGNILPGYAQHQYPPPSHNDLIFIRWFKDRDKVTI